MSRIIWVFTAILVVCAIWLGFAKKYQEDEEHSTHHQQKTSQESQSKDTPKDDSQYVKKLEDFEKDRK